MARSTVFNFRRPPTVYTPQPVSRGPPLSTLRPPAASSSHSHTGSGDRKASPRPPSLQASRRLGFSSGWRGWRPKLFPPPPSSCCRFSTAAARQPPTGSAPVLGLRFHVAHRRLVLSLSSSAESIRAHLSICSTPSTWATTKTSTIPAAPRGIFMCTRYSGLGRNTPPIAFCASSIAFFWASHCRSARSVIAFSWAFHCCSTRSVIAFR